MNVITLTGNAVKDIEIKITPNGKTVASGTIAVKRDFKNQQGEYETDFINYTALGKTGEIMANYVKKGDKFGISGRLQIRKWEKDGKTQYYTEVIVNNFDFPHKSQSNQGNTNTSSNRNNGSQGYQRAIDDPFADGGKTMDVSDDMLPF
ncbi:single-stranded DNA-binding protein [Bacillus testis]|uniref:single-stranded DNA-binding protein n=1 Tax=Bacillus testis TaxID=1622072 RepID=UPI00067EB2CA|nr:single-stranded DNA-binding protein [Bacillus testis]